WTPPDLLDRVVRCLGGIDLDPCSNSRTSPNVPALRHFTREDDGLAQPWGGKVFINPPYARDITGRWVQKLLAEYDGGAVAAALALLPNPTDTPWFQAISRYPCCLVRGRVKFINGAYSATFPSAVVYLGPRMGAFVDAFESLGRIVVPYVR